MGVLPLALAFPIVESRTGDPALRQPLVDHPISPGPLKTQEINALQEELQELRGTLEKQLHQLEEQLGRVKKSQQDLYLDIDKRLKQVETQKPKTLLKKAVSAVETSVPAEAIVVPAPKPNVVMVPETVVDNELAEKQAYDAAAAHLSAKQLPEAIKGFERFIERYPQGLQSAQAHYWLAEAYMASFEADRTQKSLLNKASQAFLVVTTRFSTHQRATDALLKLGMVEQEKGNKTLSRQYFQQVKDRYPESGAARLAEAYLQSEE